MQEEQETFLIYGIHSVIEALENHKSIDRIYIKKGASGRGMSKLQALLKKQHIKPSYVPVERLEGYVKYNHQGVVAFAAPVEFQELEPLVEAVLEKEEIPLFIILDNVTDVRNFGAIIRTAACTGVHGIIIPQKGGAAINSDTIKTSAGGVFSVPICRVAHIKDAIYYFQGSGIQVVAATEKTTQKWFSVDYALPTALLMGSEGKGIRTPLLKLADQKAQLTLIGDIDSLNVSVACGAFLYEIVRQRSV